MSLTDDGKKKWAEKLKKEGLNNVRIKLSQGEYNDEGNHIKNFIATWIRKEEERRLLRPNRISNIIAISAAIIAFLGLVTNIILTFRNK